MTLTLRAVSLNDLPLSQPITAHFDEQGGTIGRADHNTMALPDPERHISRQQAEISAGRSGFVIRNVGSANPIIVRNQSLAQGESAPLMHSDQVRIGGYLLEVIEDTEGGEGTTITRGRAAVDATAAARPRDTSVDLGGPLSSSNPFAELLGEAATPARPAPVQAAPVAAAPARLPDDFDPFAMPAAPAPKPMPAVGGGGAFDDLIPGAAPASIDDLIGSPGASGRDPLADFVADAVPSGEGGAAAPLPVDPLELFGGTPRRPVPQVPPDRTPELRGAFTPPSPVLPRRPEPPVLDEAAVVSVLPVPPQAAVTGPEAAAGTDPSDLWAAFCAGAGVELPPQGATPELMRLAGTLLRTAVEGTVQLMAVRSATRHELHAQVTVIRPRNNNPLKFSPDAQSALEQLLRPPLRGFMPAAAAMTDAMNDLVGHAIGTMAGTRAALEGVLGRFSPRELEAKLVGRSVLDSVLPMNRKAKLWELYLQHYEGIRDEAQEDFHALFGKAFLAAYEQQLERLRRDKPASAQ